MKLKTKQSSLLVCCVWVVLLAGCAASDNESESASNTGPATVSDADLQQRVQAAIASASDLPTQFRVEANAGLVRLIGSLQCENCGGNRTPGAAGTIQQSLGAVVRAVPGVTRVEFALEGGP